MIVVQLYTNNFISVSAPSLSYVSKSSDSKICLLFPLFIEYLLDKGKFGTRIQSELMFSCEPDQQLVDLRLLISLNIAAQSACLLGINPSLIQSVWICIYAFA